MIVNCLNTSKPHYLLYLLCCVPFLEAHGVDQFTGICLVFTITLPVRGIYPATKLTFYHFCLVFASSLSRLSTIIPVRKPVTVNPLVAQNPFTHSHRSFLILIAVCILSVMVFSFVFLFLPCC